MSLLLPALIGDLLRSNCFETAHLKDGKKALYSQSRTTLIIAYRPRKTQQVYKRCSTYAHQSPKHERDSD